MNKIRQTIYTPSLFKRTIFNNINSPHLFLHSLTLKYPHLIKDSSSILRYPKLIGFLNSNISYPFVAGGNSGISKVISNSVGVYDAITDNSLKNKPFNKTEIVGKLFKDIKVGRKELYDLLQNQAGIYELVNLNNNKNYIGSSSNILNRLANYSRKGHLADAAGPRRNMAIASAIIKNGWNNFGFRILEFIDYNPKLTYNENSAKL